MARLSCRDSVTFVMSQLRQKLQITIMATRRKLPLNLIIIL